MKLQFAFGANPRKPSKKKVAKRRKQKENKRVKAKKFKRGTMARRKRKKLKKVSKKIIRGLRSKRNALHKKLKRKGGSKRLKAAAKKKYAKLYKRIKKLTGKNPISYVASRDGRRIGSDKIETRKELETRLKKKYGIQLAASKAKGDYDKTNQLMAKMKDEYDAYGIERSKFLKDIKEFKASGASIKIKGSEADSVAKKKKKSKKKSVKKAASKKKRSGRRKASSKAKGRRKSSRRKKRHYPKMISHRHAKSTRHVKKGSKAGFRLKKRKKSSSYIGKGKFGKKGPSFTVRARKSKRGFSGSVKINPRRRNPMAVTVENALGLKTSEITGLVIGGALVPVVNTYLPRIPGMATVVSTINQYAGPQAAGSIVPILVGAGLNLGSDYVSGDTRKYMELAGKGMVTAGLIGLTVSLVQKGLQMALPSTPVAGINYTPRLSGINYTPSMRGMGDVRYTPRMGIVPQLGSRADFGAADYGGGGGYTESHNRSSADFGADQSSDSQADHWGSEDDMLSSQMSGSMG